MKKLNTASVSLAVTPTVVSTLLSHYLNRKPLKQRPTAHLSYDEGLHLIRSFLDFASHHTVEELQAFTAQWVPHPQWVKVEVVTISDELLDKSATLLQKQLGKDGIRTVGGRKWWQWRRPDTPLKAEWIEMRSDYHERKKKKADGGNRVMLYVHGGAYFFGSVDEHRYQMQRHARKLKARVFAPRYRLAPQFPFPCGLQDCLAAYLYLLTVQEPNTIVLAGDSAGGGMVLSVLCILRDRGLPLPAGAVLISPWVDLTHSFPSVSGENPFDYIPASGFHHKPSRAWPPPNEDDLEMIREQAAKQKKGDKSAATTGSLQDKRSAPIATIPANGKDNSSSSEATGDVPLGQEATLLSVTIGGKMVMVKDQIQMYTTNELLCHPLVSPIMQPSLGGLPPLLIMVGGGELLRDEQIYLAHKCANPSKYAPSEESLTDNAKTLLKQYKPTDVQLQVWDDLCHVAPTLSFTRPAKYMYRSIAQFSAWALARAQHAEIDILDDDDISVISNSASDTDEQEQQQKLKEDNTEYHKSPFQAQVGKAGDPLPPFRGHMIRQRVTRHGAIYPLAAPTDLPGCTLKQSDVGVIKETPVRKWLETKKQWDTRYASSKAKVFKKIVKDLAAGYLDFGDGERPPPSALAGRRKVPKMLDEKKKTKSMGLALWSLWGSKHDEMTVEREEKADREPETTVTTKDEGAGARPFREIEAQEPAPTRPEASRSRSRRRTVVDERQTQGEDDGDNTELDALLALRKEKQGEKSTFLSPGFVPETGVAGKRPMLDGIAMPFSLGKDADSASMMTLTSAISPSSRPISPVAPMNMVENDSTLGRSTTDVDIPAQETPGPDTERPGLESFVTAAEDLPKAAKENGSTAAAEKATTDQRG